MINATITTTKNQYFFLPNAYYVTIFIGKRQNVLQIEIRPEWIKIMQFIECFIN